MPNDADRQLPLFPDYAAPTTPTDAVRARVEYLLEHAGVSRAQLGPAPERAINDLFIKGPSHRPLSAIAAISIAQAIKPQGATDDWWCDCASWLAGEHSTPPSPEDLKHAGQVLRAKAEVASCRAALNKAERKYEAAKERLAKLLPFTE